MAVGAVFAVSARVRHTVTSDVDETAVTAAVNVSVTVAVTMSQTEA